jgi:hypothetical protein
VARSVCHYHDHPCRYCGRGVFAPGHLGELTQYLPFELVDDVLEQTRTVQHRLRELQAGRRFGRDVAIFPIMELNTPDMSP